MIIKVKPGLRRYSKSGRSNCRSSNSFGVDWDHLIIANCWEMTLIGVTGGNHDIINHCLRSCGGCCHQCLMDTSLIIFIVSMDVVLI